MDLEQVTKQEGEPEETVKITRVEMSETLVEEMAWEEQKVVEKCRVGAHQREFVGQTWKRNRKGSKEKLGKASGSGPDFMLKWRRCKNKEARKKAGDTGGKVGGATMG